MITEQDPKKMICEPPPPLFSAGRLIAGLLALAMSVTAIVFAMQLARHYFLPQDFQNGAIYRPVLAIELPASMGDIEKVLGIDDNNPSKVGNECNDALRKANIAMPKNADEFDDALPDVQKFCKSAQAISALRSNTWEDFLFIALYVLFLWRFAKLFVICADGTQMLLGKLVALLALGAGLADCVENVGILRALGTDHLTDAMAEATRWPSVCKWVLIGTALLVTSAILLRSGSQLYSLATRRLLAIGYLVSGGLVVVGPLRPHFIESGTGLFSLLVVVNLAALLGPYIARLIPENVPEYVTDFCRRKKGGTSDVAIRPRHSA